MNENPIVIFKKRDFGEFISAPVSFFASEFKVLAKSLLFFVGPFVLLEVILTYFFHIGYNQDIFSLISEGNNSVNSGGNLILRIVGLFQGIMLYSTVGVCIKLYVERGKGNFDTPDIWDGITKVYWPVLGGQFLAGLLIIVGALLLIIPGIYLGIVMSILFVIIIFEEEGVSKAISRAFEIIKGNWWMAFGAFIVMGLMLIIITALLSAITYLIFSMFGHGQIISAVSGTVVGFVTILMTSVLALLPVFLYTSFVADKENPVLMDRIDKISDDDTNIFEVKEIDDKKTEDDNKKFEDDTLINEEEPKTENERGEMFDEEEKKNRFESEDENDRFKPKY